MLEERALEGSRGDDDGLEGGGSGLGRLSVGGICCENDEENVWMDGEFHGMREARCVGERGCRLMPAGCEVGGEEDATVTRAVAPDMEWRRWIGIPR